MHQWDVHDDSLWELRRWLKQVLHSDSFQLAPLPGDASFREYFRVSLDGKTHVIMKASQEKNSCKSFVAVAKTFYKLGLNVPYIYAENLESGFLLLTDFGDELYLNALNERTADGLYERAFENLLLIQSCQKIDGYQLPTYNKDLLYKEMALFHEWYLEKELKWNLTPKDRMTLNRIYQLLIDDALAQPQICVHRDFHSRNLMVVKDNHNPGVLDFQDAVFGPVTYDLLSLLRDCYIDWPKERVERWVMNYYQKALDAGILQSVKPQQFLRWFDWIGLQRNLKCIGIFSRLSQRDNKPMYLQYIPRVRRYALEVCDRYPEFTPLKPFLLKEAHR